MKDKFKELVTAIRSSATSEDVTRLFELSLTAIEEVKGQLEERIASLQSESSIDVDSKIAKTRIEALKESEKRVNEVFAELHDLKGKAFGIGDELANFKYTTNIGIDQLVTKVFAELKRVESLIPSMPEIDFSPLFERISEVEGKIPRIPDPEPRMTGDEIIHGINDAEEKIDASRIKNLPRQQVIHGGGGTGVAGLTAGRNIAIENDSTYAGYKVVRLDVTVSSTPPSNPVQNQLWIEI
ncbi:MAG: hypothetical protein WDZ75_01710 [Candidatus Paceibacterota bacterium]